MLIKQKMRFVIALSVLLLSLAVISFYLYNNRDLVILLKNLSFKSTIILIFLRLLFVGLNGLFLRIYSGKLNVHLVWYEWMGLPYITTMGNYLTPLSGGMLARAVYLKNRHSLSFTNFTMLLAANYLITFWVVSLMVIFILPFLWQQTTVNWVLLIFFIVCFILLTLILIMPTPDILSKKRILRHLNQALSGWKAVKDDRYVLLQLFLLTAVSLILNAASFWLSYDILRMPVSVPSAIMISLSAVFSTIITVTPGNFGIREAFISFMAAIVGVGGGSGLMVALLVRGCTLMSVFTLGPLFLAILTNKACIAPDGK